MNTLKKLSFLPLLAVLFMLSSCGKPGPSDVASDFLTAISHGDWEKAKELSTEDTKQLIGTLQMFAAGEELEESPGSFKIDREEIDGDYATVYYTAEGEEGEQELKLKKVDGEWKVMFDKSDMDKGDEDMSFDWDDENMNFDDEFDAAWDSLDMALDSLGSVMEDMDAHSDDNH